MPEDADLLRRYSRDRADDAFAEIVRHHIDLVYGVALRRCRGDAQLAQDVAQLVFADCARKASTLADHPALTGWFFTSTHFTATQLVRSESRRRTRETVAAAMNANALEAEPDWERVRPLLDELICDLDERDRSAVLLRFFEGRPYAEVAARLGLSEDGARSRVDRALDKLHAALGSRGVKSTGAALSVALANQAGASAPAGLATTVTSAVLLKSGATGASGALLGIFMSKITSALLAAGLVVATAVIVYQTRSDAQLLQTMDLLRAEKDRAISEQQASDATVRKLRDDLRGAKAEHDELLRLRVQLAAVTPVKKESAPPAPAVTPTQAKLAADFVNAGQATPAAAIETVYWAVAHVDLVALRKAVLLTPETEVGFDAIFAGLSKRAQDFFGDSTTMAAATILSAGRLIQSLEILDPAPPATDEVQLRVRIQNDRGQPRDYPLPPRRFKDGWKWIYSAPGMDDPQRRQGMRQVAEQMASRQN